MNIRLLYSLLVIAILFNAAGLVYLARFQDSVQQAVICLQGAIGTNSPILGSYVDRLRWKFGMKTLFAPKEFYEKDERCYYGEAIEP